MLYPRFQRARATATRLGAAVLVLAFSVGCSFQSEPEFSAGSGMIGSGPFEFTFGTAEPGPGKPALLFQTSSTTVPVARQYSFLIVVRAVRDEASREDGSDSGGASFEGNQFDSSHVHYFDGFKVALDRTVIVDQAASSIVSESLQVQGVTIDLSKGRLILLDPMAEPGDWVQLAVSLPEAPGDLDDVSRFTVETVDDLAVTNDAVQALFRR